MAARDCFWAGCHLLELLEGMLEGKREFDEMHSLTDPAAFAKVVHVLYPDSHFNYFAGVGKTGGFVLCLHPDVQCVAEARRNAALMQHLWFGHQKDSVTYLSAAMVGELLDKHGGDDKHEKDKDKHIEADDEDVEDRGVIARRVRRDLHLLAHLLAHERDDGIVQTYDPLTQTWTAIKPANKRKRDAERDAEWYDVSRLVRCAVPMLDARYRPYDTCLEIASQTGDHPTYEINVLDVLLLEA